MHYWKWLTLVCRTAANKSACRSPVKLGHTYYNYSPIDVVSPPYASTHITLKRRSGWRPYFGFLLLKLNTARVWNKLWRQCFVCRQFCQERFLATILIHWSNWDCGRVKLLLAAGIEDTDVSINNRCPITYYLLIFWIIEHYLTENPKVKLRVLTVVRKARSYWVKIGIFCCKPILIISAFCNNISEGCV